MTLPTRTQTPAPTICVGPTFLRTIDMGPTNSESQNHRIVGVGRDLCGSSSPTLLPKQGHLQQAAQDSLLLGDPQVSLRLQSKSPGKYSYQLTRAGQISAKAVSMKGRPQFKNPRLLP